MSLFFKAHGDVTPVFGMARLCRFAAGSGLCTTSCCVSLVVPASSRVSPDQRSTRSSIASVNIVVLLATLSAVPPLSRALRSAASPPPPPPSLPFLFFFFFFFLFRVIVPLTCSSYLVAIITGSKDSKGCIEQLLIDIDCNFFRFKANIPAVSTFRAKFSSAKHQETDSPSVNEISPAGQKLK